VEFATFVAGRPRPKGSLDGLASGRARESNKASAAWREEVAGQCRAWAATIGWTTLDAPVVVTGLRFLFDRPAAPRWPVPATVETGDTDKLLRNVLDALSACDARCPKTRQCRKHAAIYADDALVTDVLDMKCRYASSWGMAGVYLALRPLDLSALPRYGPLEAESLGARR